MKSERSQADLAKLPVWARERIERAEGALKEARDALRARDTIGEAASIIVNPRVSAPGCLDQQVGFDEQAQVLFREAGRGWGGIAMFRRGNQIEVMAQHGTLVVQPRASNVVWLAAQR